MKKADTGHGIRLFSFQLDQCQALTDHLAFLEEQRLDHACMGGTQAVFHFHGFQYHQLSTGFDGLPDFNQYTHDAAVHRCGQAALGRVAGDANSQLRLELYSKDPQEARDWLPAGPLHKDLRVLLRVYLGWRCTAKLQLTLPLRSLPKAVLGHAPMRLGMTAVLGLGGDAWQAAEHQRLTINLGRYQGLSTNPCNRETQHVAYSF